MSTITKTSAKKGQLVDGKHVDSLLGNYKRERWIHNTKRLGKEDSLSVTFGISEMSEFMKIARENGADGIRVYFGVYGENTEKRPEYIGRQTIVMVAVKEKRNEDGRLVTKHLYYQTENGAEILAFNTGNICPPFCGPIGDPTDGDGGYGYIIQDQGLGLTFLNNDEGATLVL
jgi:hypothetical protein